MTQIPAPAAAVILALLPAAFTLWWGRKLAQLADDPALPERLFAHRKRTTLIVSISLGILVWESGAHVAWALPVMLIARLAAAYPLRKALHEDTWNLAGYLSFFLRLTVAFMGFWIVLAAAPLAAASSGSWRWIAAVSITAILCGWNHYYGPIFRFVMRARTFEHLRFPGMVEQCGLRGVALEDVPLAGGTFANAVALPSVGEPAVVVSETLVTRLDSEEMAAILGHELAHLEHFNPARLRRLNAITLVLIVTGGLIGPVLNAWYPSSVWATALTWPVVLVVFLGWRARLAQKNETASDLRAIALTGNPDALIRALCKLHAFALVPRRWDTDFERQASHPSLARRIQDIREAAGSAPAALGEAALFEGSDGRASVTFHDDRLDWSEAPQASHVLSYGLLTELRIHAPTSGSTRLVAVDGGKRRWQIALRDEDVARAQATLDIVDSRLGRHPASASGILPAVRALAMVAVMSAVVLSQWAAALVALFAVALPAAPIVAAAGAASLTAAALIWRDGSTLSAAHPWMAFGLVAGGFVLLAAAFVTRHEPRRPEVSQLLMALGASATIAWAIVALWGLDIFQFHRGMHAWPAACVLTIALAGAFVFERARTLKYASTLVALAGACAGFVGSTTFLDRFASDPFLASAAPVAWRTIERPADTTLELAFQAADLRLSPRGTAWAIFSEGVDDETTIHAGRVSGSLKDFDADQAIFVDEDQLLLLNRRHERTDVRLVTLDDHDRSGWSLQLPMHWAGLSFDPASRTWRALGWSEDDAIVSVTGSVAGGRVQERRWKPPAGADAVEAVAVMADDLLALETQVSKRFLGDVVSARVMTLIEPRPPVQYRLWNVSASSIAPVTTSRLQLSCDGVSVDEHRTLCSVLESTRTRFFAVDSRADEPVPLASVPGRFFPRSDAGDGWLTGWWDGHPVVVRAATREGLMLHQRERNVRQLTIAAGTLGAIAHAGDGSTLSLYRLD